MINTSSSKILITGANGFVGHYLCQHFYAKGFSVIALGRSPECNHKNYSKYYSLDLIDDQKIAEIFSDEQPDYIVHLASSRERNQAHVKIMYQQNVNVSLKIIEEARKLALLKKFIFFGSCEEYGRANTPYSEEVKEMPMSLYGLTKLAISNHLQMLIQTQNFPCIIFRPSVIFGAGQKPDMLIPIVISKLLNGEEWLFSPGEQTRDFLHVDDVVSAVDVALDISHKGIFNLSYGTSFKVVDVIRKIGKELGCEHLIKIGVLSYKENETMDYRVSNSKTVSTIGWKPLKNFDVGLKETIDFFVKNSKK